MNVAVAVFFTAVACWGLGLLTGYGVGKRHVMTKKEAARVMARESWRNR